MKLRPSIFLVLLLNLGKHLMMITGNQQFFLFQLQRPLHLYCKDLNTLYNAKIKRFCTFTYNIENFSNTYRYIFVFLAT